MLIYYFCSSPNITLILLCLGSNFQLFKNSTKMLWRSVFHSISNRPIIQLLFPRFFFSFLKLVQSKMFFKLLLQLCSIGVKNTYYHHPYGYTLFSHANLQPFLIDLFFSCASYWEYELYLESAPKCTPFDVMANIVIVAN